MAEVEVLGPKLRLCLICALQLDQVKIELSTPGVLSG